MIQRTIIFFDECLQKLWTTIQSTLHFSAFMSSLGVSSSLLQIDEPKLQTTHFRQLLVVASSRHISSLLVPSAAAWSLFRRCL
ncbi:hypothetical protein [Parasitella parasitica]|uniref:Uncharacterized protein n=1 Tax=Parasitella parasitica TaxID=35722 RepID=A0A0B7NB54_9FUNG|nr:hypothetical protein [Parasitella parasitica]